VTYICADQEDIAFGRLMRTVSRSSSTRSAIHTHEDERTPVIEDDEEEEPPPISMFTILKKNMPEWPYILLGSIGSIVVGFAMPIFGVLFGDIIGVSKLREIQAANLSIMQICNPTVKHASRILPST